VTVAEVEADQGRPCLRFPPRGRYPVNRGLNSSITSNRSNNGSSWKEAIKRSSAPSASSRHIRRRDSPSCPSLP
jgi:hypothetical protein